MARPILKSMATVSGLTMISRILGFARQMLLAGIIGASANPAADAFWVAFRLPNMFRRLLAEGAFQAAFVPLFQGHAVKGDLTEARKFAEDILAWLVVILTGLTAIVMIFTPFFVNLLATGFRSDPERFDLAIAYSRIMFPYLTCMSIVGLYGGMLNALHRFAAAAAAPVLLNICLIVGVLIFAKEEARVTGYAAAWAVAISGLLQLGALVYAASRSALLLRLRLPRFSGAAKRMLLLGAPGFIGASALQVNGIIGTNIASRQLGANSWLSFADQLYQLPLAMIGIALGIVLMPAIGKSVKSGDERGARHTLNRGLEVALFFALPAGAALVVLAQYICAALFQDFAGDVTRMIGAGKSAFNDHDTAMTGLALMIYGFGLPAFVMQKVLAAAYFAREDTKSPMIFALTAIAINATVSISLFPVLGFISVPIGTIAASWVEVTGLATRLTLRGHLQPGWSLLSRLVRMLGLAIALGVGLNWFVQHADQFTQYTLGQSWLLLLLIAALGVIAYGLAALATGAIRRADLRPVKK